jgi:hypothetical protein
MADNICNAEFSITSNCNTVTLGRGDELNPVDLSQGVALVTCE